MNPNLSRVVVLLVLSLILVALLAQAADDQEATSATLSAASTSAAATPAAVSTDPERAAAAARAAVVEQIQAVLVAERSALAALAEQEKVTAGGEAAIALQREIEQVKHAAQVRILQLQLDFMRETGRLDQAAVLEAALRRLSSQEQGAAPQPSAAPAAPSGTP
jgi:hypothetical protein